MVVLPLACVEVGFRRIRSHPCEGHRLRSTVVYVPLKTRYTGFSSIQRGITVPEVAVPAAVLVNAKLTPSREAPPRPRTSPRPRYFSLGQKPVALREPILQPLQPRCPGCCCCSCCTASDVCERLALDMLNDAGFCFRWRCPSLDQMIRSLSDNNRLCSTALFSQKISAGVPEVRVIDP